MNDATQVVDEGRSLKATLIIAAIFTFCYTAVSVYCEWSGKGGDFAVYVHIFTAILWGYMILSLVLSLMGVSDQNPSRPTV